MKSIVVSVLIGLMSASVARAQQLGGAGTIQGTVKDPSGGVMVAVTVDLSNPVTGFKRSVTTDAAGKFVFRNLPPNSYHVAVTAQGFEPLERDADVRSAVPVELDLALTLEGATTAVEVVGHAGDLLERDPAAHTDLDQSLLDKLPVESSSGLNQQITLAAPGVVADSNGFFHPVGDHAQTQFSIDNQPVTDQQSRVYSNQISPDAVQAMEVITGVAPAEYGDKSSLVVHIVTKSGLDQPRPTGTVGFSYGSFNSPTLEANVGGGSHSAGNFLSISGMRSDRYLDPPEFEALHGQGNSQSFFDRFDTQSASLGSLHLNTQWGRSSFEVPNTYDQNDLGQNQHQKITTINVAPGYSRVIGLSSVLTANLFVRQDHVLYSPSADPFADTPGTVSQDRRLRNIGAKVDFAYTARNHNVKVGGTIGQTHLDEAFTFGITDPALNAPDSPDYNPDLRPFDLTRGGQLFNYNQTGTIKSQAVYAQDEIKAGDATFTLGVRVDHYDGLTSATLAQPRLGASYAVKSGTVFRASYGRTLETPYNENLLLSSGVGTGGIFGGAGALSPGKRREFEVGVQQGFGRWVVVDLGYFEKRTDNAYDFGVLFDTPIVFPISWDHSKLNGITGRVNLVEHHGFSAFTVFGHTNAIFSPPGNGGILIEDAAGDFRIDHDQKFQQTTNLQYVFNKATGAWAALNWRYDSGLVAGSVATVEDALALSADQQAAIGFYCGSVVATRDQGITSCPSGGGATRLVIPADGTEDDVNNPPRIAPRHLFDIAIGADNVFHGDKTRVKIRFSVLNVTNKEALYNFLSTFSGTHFVSPRAYQVEIGVGF